MNLFNDTEMQELSGEDQARKALFHLLKQIRRDEYVGWYLGVGTQNFSLITEAYATLTQQNVAKVREQFQPMNPRNPREEGA
jgi:hypothetical protein